MILDMLYPKRCAICDSVLGRKEQYLCSRCISLPVLVGQNYCMKCGKPVTAETEFCSDCRKKETVFLSGRAVFLYDSSLQTSISRFKYHGRQEYAQYYAREMYQQYRKWIEEREADAFIPVPLHIKRYRKRGFNQAALIAENLSRMSGIPVISDFLIRSRNTLPQKELTEQERLQNLCQAFQINSAREKLYNNLKCVIIIDDIYTTGSTIEACSQVLENWGINRIYFLCVCTGYSL